MGSRCAGTFPGGPSWEKEQDTRKSSECALLVLGRLLEARRPAALFISIRFFPFLAEVPRRCGAISQVSEGTGMCLCPADSTEPSFPRVHK